MQAIERRAAAPFRETGGSLYVKALSTVLGETELTVEDAVAQGRYAPEQADKDGYVAVRACARSAPEMALAAAGSALAAAAAGGEELSLVTYSHIHAHGHRRLWQPAAALQRAFDAPGALGWTLSHGCNGQILALAEACLALPRLGGYALSVAADRYEGSSFDRFSSDSGLVYGDAAAAALLSTEEGFARVSWIDVENAPEFEELHRTGTPDATPQDEWDISGAKARFIAAHGKEAFFTGVARALETLRARLVEGAGLAEGACAFVVTPFVGWSVARTTYAHYFHPLGRANSRAVGARIGHTGAGDQLVGLAAAIAEGHLRRGDRALLIGAGAGFSFGAVVLDILTTPRVHANGAIS